MCTAMDNKVDVLDRIYILELFESLAPLKTITKRNINDIKPWFAIKIAIADRDIPHRRWRRT